MADMSYLKDMPIAVLGGGDVGCETAVYLAMELGKKVTLA